MRRHPERASRAAQRGTGAAGARAPRRTALRRAPPALAFVTLGCPKNTVDSEHMLARVAELKRAGRLKALLVTGCLAQRAGASLLSEFPEVDVVLGTGQWREVARAARHVLDGGAPRIARTARPGGALESLAPRAL